MCTDTIARVDEILGRYPGASRDALIPILQQVQAELGFLSRDAVIRVGEHLALPASKIFGVATFYNQFRFQAPGENHIQVCRGTACHVKGSGEILRTLQRELSIEPDETTRDGKFSLEVVACIGACGLAPVIAVNGEFHAKLTEDSAKKVIEDYRSRDEDEGAKA